jgi:hypothetical protein
MKKIIFGGICGMVILIISYTFLKRNDAAATYYRYFKVQLHPNFKEFKIKKYFTGRMHVEYELPEEDLMRMLKLNLSGYTMWKPLVQEEYGTPERDYDNETNPGAYACKKITKKELTFIIVDIKMGRVFGFYSPQ